MQRLFEIVYLLMERGNMTATELASHFEVSSRTISRDVDALSAAGIPVYATRGRNGGIQLLPNFVLNKTLLSAKEQDEILFALQSLQAVGAVEAQNVLSRLSGLFRRQQVDWIDVDFSRWGSGRPEKKKYQLIKEAILSGQILQFNYYSAKGESTQRTVEPCRLNFKSSAWYLQGWCQERNDYRTFKVSRMEGLFLSEHHYLPRPQPLPDMDDPEDTLPMQHVLLHFSHRVAFRVLDEFSRSCITPQKDGSFLVETDWPVDAWGCGYLLSFGAEVEVLAPPELRVQMQQETEKIMQQYIK